MTTPALPVWGTDGTNNAAPITTQQKSGWTLGQDGVSSYDNWYKELVYEWIKRLAQRDYLQALIPAVTTAASPEMFGQETPTDYVYAITPHGGQAFLRQGTANNKIQIAPGLLMQLAGGEVLTYEFDGTTEYAVANGDLTNPRVDILQMQIVNAAGDAASSVTVNIKQGPPAASPTYPAPDPGFCVIAGVVVSATYSGSAAFVFDDTAGVPSAVLHDQRMPIGQTPVRTDPKNFHFDATTPHWSLAGTGDQVGATVDASGSARPLTVALNHGSWVGRVLAVEVPVYDTNLLTTYIGKRTLSDTGGGAGGAGVTVDDTTLNAALAARNTSIFGTRFGSFAYLQAHHAPWAGPVVQANANGMGPPIWTNGRRCAGPRFVASTNPFLETIILSLIADGGTQVGPVTFYLAGGL